jgi:tetratricopeptide (TPR) repeat protein
MLFRGWLVRRTLSTAAMLLLAILSLEWIPASALAQTLMDRKCTGKSDIPDDQQILGCSEAIRSRAFAGKDLAVAFSNRGRAYLDKGDLDHAIADYDQAIAVDASSAAPFYGRGATYFAKKENDHAKT